MKETIVYYYKHNPNMGDLYHSIQSLKKFHRNLGNIYILTDDDIPFEDKQIIKIHVENVGPHKEYILINKLKTFCEMGLCENFIHMSDDFFINKPFDASDLLPPMTIDDMKDTVKPYPNMPSLEPFIGIHYGYFN